MFKIVAFVFMVIACVCAKPQPDVIAYSAPIVATPLATSSQFFARSSSPYVAYPYVAAYSSPYVAATPYAAAPYSAAPYAAYTAPVLI